MIPGTINKEQVQKIVLSAIGFVALVYVYFTFFLGPLDKRLAAAEASISDLQKKYAASEPELAEAGNPSEDTAGRLEALLALSPNGAPIAWFPPRLNIIFANQEIENTNIRLETSTAFKESEMAGWNQYIWAIDLPHADFISFGKAVAEIENEELLVAVTEIEIKAAGEDPQFQQVTLKATSTFRE